ncbi:MAG: hypothetical protein IPL83_00750 [Bdellovibrionales bacterium]|nr:hypothetical protein [Bdellovibrionales bacterium]
MARSLVMKPRVLLLDDPTTGIAGSRVSKLAEVIHQGRMNGQIDFVFFVSEDMSFVRKIATRTIEIKDQRIHQTEAVQAGFIIVEKEGHVIVKLNRYERMAGLFLVGAIVGSIAVTIGVAAKKGGSLERSTTKQIWTMPRAYTWYDGSGLRAAGRRSERSRAFK